MEEIKKDTPSFVTCAKCREELDGRDAIKEHNLWYCAYWCYYNVWRNTSDENYFT